MKILLIQKQYDIAKRIVANHIIAQDAIYKANMNVEEECDALSHLINNTIEVLYTILPSKDAARTIEYLRNKKYSKL